MDCFPKELLHLILNNLNIVSLLKSKLICKDTFIVANEILCDIKFYIENKDTLDLIKENFIHINFAIKLKKFDNWNLGLYYACKGGHLDIVNLMIEKGAKHWNYGLQGACEGGHLAIVNLMIDKGANNWNLGLYYACEGGHLNIINYMIEKGATDWNEGLRGACFGGHLDIINLMIEKGANPIICKDFGIQI